MQPKEAPPQQPYHPQYPQYQQTTQQREFQKGTGSTKVATTTKLRRLSPRSKKEDTELAGFLLSLKHSSRSVSPEPSESSSSVENHTPPYHHHHHHQPHYQLQQQNYQQHRAGSAFTAIGGRSLASGPVMPYTSTGSTSSTSTTTTTVPSYMAHHQQQQQPLPPDLQQSNSSSSEPSSSHHQQHPQQPLQHGPPPPPHYQQYPQHYEHHSSGLNHPNQQHHHHHLHHHPAPNASSTSPQQQPPPSHHYRQQYYDHQPLVDTSDIPFPPPPRPSAPIEIHFDELLQNSHLVEMKDRDLVPDSLFAAMAQMKPCALTQADRVGCYKSRAIGFIGMCCMHCGGQPGFGRFFPNSVRSLAQTTTSQTILKHVSQKCRYCPSRVRNAVVELQRQQAAKEGAAAARPRYGSRKIFFQRIWTRLHSSNHPMNETAAGAVGEEGEEGQRCDNEQEVGSMEAHLPSPPREHEETPVDMPTIQEVTDELLLSPPPPPPVVEEEEDHRKRKADDTGEVGDGVDESDDAKRTKHANEEDGTTSPSVAAV